MDELIPHSDNVRPGDLRDLSAGFGRDSSCRLPDDLEILEQREDQQAIVFTMVTRFPLNKSQRLDRCIKHVADACDISLVHRLLRS